MGLEEESQVHPNSDQTAPRDPNATVLRSTPFGIKQRDRCSCSHVRIRSSWALAIRKSPIIFTISPGADYNVMTNANTPSHTSVHVLS